MRRLMNLPTWRRKKGKLSQCGCMVGFWYSAVNVKSEQSHRVKALLGSRDQLVRAKRALGNQVRGVLRPFGIRLLSRQGTKKFSTAAHQAVRHDAMFNANVTALLESAGGNRGSDCALGSATEGSWRDAGEKLSWKPEILGFRLVFYQETTNYTLKMIPTEPFT
jgi:hypothetical protein